MKKCLICNEDIQDYLETCYLCYVEYHGRLSNDHKSSSLVDTIYFDYNRFTEYD